MKVLPTLLLALLLASPAMAADNASDPLAEARIEAGKLLDVMKMDETLQVMMDTLLDAEMERTPELAPYRQVMTDFFLKHMSYASLRSDMVDIYAGQFTAEELRAARAFYSTPAGLKFMELTPQLARQGAELGNRRVTANLPELEKMIRAEQQRLAKLAEEAEAIEAIGGKATKDPGSIPEKDIGD